MFVCAGEKQKVKGKSTETMSMQNNETEKILLKLTNGKIAKKKPATLSG